MRKEESEKSESERAGDAEGGMERLTLKSVRASVCKASEGRVVRGELSPFLQKHKASLLHSAESGETTHTHP